VAVEKSSSERNRTEIVSPFQALAGRFHCGAFGFRPGSAIRLNPALSLACGQTRSNARLPKEKLDSEHHAVASARVISRLVLRCEARALIAAVS
jgi:hypothetical protein